MELDEVCKSACKLCSDVILILDTLKPSFEELPDEIDIKRQVAKVNEYMKRLCSQGKLHKPKEFNEEIDVSYKGITLKTYAIKAPRKPIRAYGWFFEGRFYVSFYALKKTQKLPKPIKEKLERTAKDFIDEVML